MSSIRRVNGADHIFIARRSTREIEEAPKSFRNDARVLQVFELEVG